MTEKQNKPEPIPTYFVVKDFLEKVGMSASTFGLSVIGNPNLFRRLRDGNDITTRTDQKIRSFISQYGKPETLSDQTSEVVE